VYHDLNWSQSEKKIARRVYDAALETELAETIAEFKARAAAVASPHAMWELGRYLDRQRRKIEDKYDYRYSQLLLLFARLLREGRIREDQLHGLSEEKLSYIRRIVSL
jgi:photoprotection regulator FRP-like protein